MEISPIQKSYNFLLRHPVITYVTAGLLTLSTLQSTWIHFLNRYDLEATIAFRSNALVLAARRSDIDRIDYTGGFSTIQPCFFPFGVGTCVVHNTEVGISIPSPFSSGELAPVINTAVGQEIGISPLRINAFVIPNSYSNQ